MCLTANKENQLPFPKPENYDAERYGLLLKYLKEWEKQRGSAPSVDDLFIRVNIQGTDKYDFNNKGAFSTDYIGGSYGYPDGTYAEREQIIQDHYDYTAGLFWFLVNDERVPAATRLRLAHGDLRQTNSKLPTAGLSSSMSAKVAA